MVTKSPSSEIQTLVQVAVDIPTLTEPLLFKAEGIDISIGDVAAIPIRNGYKPGIVVGFSDKTTNFDIKPVYQIIGKRFLDEKQVQLAKEIANYYCCPLFEALKLFLPAGYSLKISIETGSDGVVHFDFKKPLAHEKTVSVVELIKIPEKTTEKQKAVIEYLQEKSLISKKELMMRSNVSSAVIDGLVKKGFVSLSKMPVERHPEESYCEDYGRPQLNVEQQKAYLQVKKALENDKEKVFVLLGVTASGKTEIYLRSIEECLKLKKTAIYLLPEISLTPQVNSRLKSRFGNKVAILHSNMTTGERFDQYQGIKEGRYKIVVGPRSALFAPLPDIGLIVIDEEQEASYKQNRSPRYDAREVALMKAKLEKAVVVYGSATPSVERLYMALKGDYELLSLPKRAVGGKYKVSLVDLRSEPNKDNCLSRYLKRKIEELPDNEKAVIFLNRRGFSGFLICRQCGHVPKCTDCDVSLTLHGKYLICHYCNKILMFNNNCIECKAPLNKFLAAGTQRVEWELKKGKNDLPVIRMDADTTSEKGSHGKKLNDFRQTPGAILVGTQMIAKGLDYPEVSVVGAVNTDIGLNMPDFRSSERVFQLIYQLCGRAGRGTTVSEVVLQSYEPQNETIKDILKGDYMSFCEYEIKRRKELDYPPHSKLINIGIKGKNLEKVKETAKKIAEKIKELDLKKIKNILGPSSAPLSYLKKNYRWHILIKVDIDFKDQLMIYKAANSCNKKDVSIIVDVDPVSML